MVDPEREPLAGLVEVDETSPPFRTKDDPVAAKPGRSREGKLLVAGAVEIVGKGPGRVRLAVIGDYSAATLNAFVAGNVVAGSTVVSDGWSGYATLTDVKHEPKVVGETPAHLVLPWVHRVFANAKRGARRLPRTPPAAPPGLPRRVRVPLRSTPLARRRLRASPGPRRRSPARPVPDVDQPELTGQAVQVDRVRVAVSFRPCRHGRRPCARPVGACQEGGGR